MFRPYTIRPCLEGWSSRMNQATGLADSTFLSVGQPLRDSAGISPDFAGFHAPTIAGGANLAQDEVVHVTLGIDPES
jgi:hypothetical protein